MCFGSFPIRTAGRTGQGLVTSQFGQAFVAKIFYEMYILLTHPQDSRQNT